MKVGSFWHGSCCNTANAQGQIVRRDGRVFFIKIVEALEMVQSPQGNDLEGISGQLLIKMLFYFHAYSCTIYNHYNYVTAAQFSSVYHPVLFFMLCFFFFKLKGVFRHSRIAGSLSVSVSLPVPNLSPHGPKGLRSRDAHQSCAREQETPNVNRMLWIGSNRQQQVVKQFLRFLRKAPQLLEQYALFLELEGIKCIALFVSRNTREGGGILCEDLNHFFKTKDVI